MKKLPFADTIWEGYRMAFTRFPDLVRVAWLPWVAGIGIPFSLFRFWEAEFSQPPVSHSGWLGVSILVAVVAYLAGALSTAAAMLRVLVLDEKSRDVIAQWRLGRDELRLLGAYVIVLGIVFAVMAAFASIGAIALASGVQQAQFGRIIVPAFILVWLGFYYFFVRAIMLFPHVIAEKRLDFLGAWQLSRRNFWRLFGVMFVGGVLLSTVVGPVMASIFVPAITVGPGRAVQIDSNRLVMGFMVVGFLMNVVQTALIAASYNYLSGRNAGASEAEPS
jgi:hypothetical protein